MHDGIHPTRLTRSRRAHLLTVALLLSVSGVVVAGCEGSSSNPAAATRPIPTVATTVPTGPVRSETVTDCLLSDSCYAPHQYRVAYGIQPLLDRGIDGRGETVTVVDPYPSSKAPAGPPRSGKLPPLATDIRQDLAAFDSEFRLPAARIQVVTSLAGSASPWRADAEEVLDTEVVHTVAPGATLRVVLLPSEPRLLKSAATATADLLAALPLAVSDTDVVSISGSLGEHYFTRAQVAELHSILLGAAAHHVTVDASSGDHGASSDPWWGMPVKEVSLPASDPLVLGVGGTRLTANRSTGAYVSETTMGGGGGGGSGGGFSHLYARPAYQDGVPGISKMRGVPDVSGAAMGSIPVVFTSGSKTYILGIGGTSASAPLWGGLIALADQYAHHDLGFVNPAIYRIARSSSYHKAFHDITTGNNTVTIGSAKITGYQAAPGWDPVTGWGSPNAQVLVPLLARLTSHRKT
jgi:subtilase family serine protease